jgi:hypothetical protein
LSHDLNGPRRCVRLVRGRVCGFPVAAGRDYCYRCGNIAAQERNANRAQQQGPRGVKS